MNSDNDQLELLERQLAERITARVRPALFRLYATVGVAVIAALGFVSWDIVEDIKSEIKTDVTNAIDQEIGEKRTEILEQVTETRIMAKRVNRVIQRLEIQLDEFQPQAENLDETIEKVKALNVNSQDLIAAYSQQVQPLIANVESLSNQLGALAEQVNQLNTIAMAGEPDSDQESAGSSRQRSAAIQSVIVDTKDAEERFAQARSKTTVFFQFAGGSRERAEAISAVLKKDGYIVPGEDRESGAAGKHEIRYFHDEDEAEAIRLAENMNRALANSEFRDHPARVDITARSFVSYRGKKPRPGVLELWLEIPSM
jgi:DNA repair exonuclease SbcCD ATPase subunit